MAFPPPFLSGWHFTTRMAPSPLVAVIDRRSVEVQGKLFTVQICFVRTPAYPTRTIRIRKVVGHNSISVFHASVFDFFFQKQRQFSTSNKAHTCKFVCDWTRFTCLFQS